MAIPDTNAELSPQEEDIRQIYAMEVNEQRLIPRDETPQEKTVLRAVDAIPHLPVPTVPESVKKQLEEAHELFHAGQEVYDPRCSLCVADPQFQRGVPVRFKREVPSEEVTAIIGGGPRVKRRGEYKARAWGSISNGGKIYGLGYYSSREFANYAYDVAVRLLLADPTRIKFKDGLPTSITESIARTIEDNVLKRLIDEGVETSQPAPVSASPPVPQPQEAQAPEPEAKDPLKLTPHEAVQRREMSKGLRSDSTSGLKGVSWYSRIKKWQVHIKKDGKSVFLGYFSDSVEAGKIYDAKARELFGEFATLNFPTQPTPVFAPPSPSESPSQEPQAPVSGTEERVPS